MSDTLPTGEEEAAEIDAPEPEALASELGLELTAEERAEAEKMVARLKEQFSLGEEPQEEPEPEPSEPEPAEEPEPEPEQPVEQPAEAELVNIGGRLVPMDEARSMMELRQYLAANPDKAERVRAAIAEEPQPQPEPEPEPQPPEFLDMEDPAHAFMWNQFLYQHKQLAQLQQTQAQQQAETARSRALEQVQGALSTFRTNHPELTEDDIEVVRTHAVALNIIPGLEKVTKSGADAVLKALDLAYMDHPEFRAKATGVPSPKEQKATESKARKAKLAGIAGSSVNAPREPEPQVRPNSDREMRAQAAKWLSEQNIL